MDKFVNIESVEKQLSAELWERSLPFNHAVIDGFLTESFALHIVSEFPSAEEPRWLGYDSSIENKLLISNWNDFPAPHYQLFSVLTSSEFSEFIGRCLGMSDELYPDPGLHGGGLHCHKNGGFLNPHLDYKQHPKMFMRRYLNLILYCNKEWESSWGGQLELWTGDERPESISRSIEPMFNRAVIFDASRDFSWHGVSQKINTPPGICRQSLAVYFLKSEQKDSDSINMRRKARFFPRSDQMNDKEVLNLIEKRASESTASSVYQIDKDQG